jgi:hypothetical protein
MIATVFVGSLVGSLLGTFVSMLALGVWAYLRENALKRERYESLLKFQALVEKGLEEEEDPSEQTTDSILEHLMQNNEHLRG